VFDKVAWIREYISLLSEKEVKRWLFLMAVAFAFYFVMGGGGGWYSPLYAIFSIARTIGWILATGFPFVIGASLLLCSDQTRNNIVERTRTGEEVRFSYLFVSYTILTLVVMTLVSVAGLVIGVSASGNVAILSVLPQLLGITLFISLLLTPIYTIIAIQFDSMSKSITIGFFISIALVAATGQPGFSSGYPEIAFFGPAHLLTALLFISIGAYGNYSADYYVGTDFQLIHVISPILVWIFFSIVCYYGARRVFPTNLLRWIKEREGWLADEQSKANLDDSTLPANLPTLRKELYGRQRKSIAVSVAIIILIFISGFGYVQVKQGELTQVVYESPAGGESVAIGDWLSGSFTGIDPPSSSISLGVTCQGRILDWSGGAGDVFFTFEHRAMTWSEFQSLNETEFSDLFDQSEHGNMGVIGTFGGGLSGPIHNVEYVWVLRFNDVNGQTSGSVNIWFQVIIRASIY
jgi:hypothetical protein